MAGFNVGDRVRIRLQFRKELCRKLRQDRYLSAWNTIALTSKAGTVVRMETHSTAVLWDGQPHNFRAWLYPTAELVNT